MNHTKLYILTGFLGSGKTTLLLELLEQLKDARVGVIQNEFGKRSIDGEILRRDGMEMVEINRGSIFCSCLKLTFVNALAEMSKHDFDYLFVESSGLGDPSNVEEILTAVEVVSEKSYDFAGVICAVDALHFMEQLGDLETVNRQLKHCNLAIITKADLVGRDQLDALRARIRLINPVCPVAPAINGKLDLDFLHEDLRQYRWAAAEESTNVPETKPKTLFMELSEPVEEAGLRAFLEAVAPSVYRVKGFAEVKDRGLCQVDLVGQRVDFKQAERRESCELVFISRIGTAVIRELMDQWAAHVGSAMKLKN